MSKLSGQNRVLPVRIAEAIIKDKDGKVLLLKRSKENARYAHKWQLPGGKVEDGENFLDAVKREVFEETGCKCISAELIGETFFSTLFKGKKSFVDLNVFLCDIGSCVVLSLDHCEAKYFEIKDIKKSMLTPVSKYALFLK